LSAQQITATRAGNISRTGVGFPHGRPSIEQAP
jgi:hypothetical protein